MLYLIRSYKYKGSILKVGFTESLEKRLSQYFFANPGFEVLSVRPGDEVLEDMIQIYLKFLGYQYQKNGRLNEWFLDSPEVPQIFHISREELENKLWKWRDKIFSKDLLTSNVGYNIFEYLYEKNKESFIGEEFYFIEGKPVETKAKKSDILFWEIYRRKNCYPKEITNPVVKDFLENHFYQTGNFALRMELYCYFRDTHKNSPEVLLSLEAGLEDQKFSQYYEYYGTSGCKAKNYKEVELYRGWKNTTKEEELKSRIYSTFIAGKKYSMTEIKDILSGFHQELGITTKAKATDLAKYYKISKTKVTDQDGKIVNGFKLDVL